MDRFRNDIFDYCNIHSSDLDQVLYELERETNLKTLAPQMLSGALQGKLLRALSQMIAPNRILEIGTFTGYATICLAKGLKEEGSITTIEINEELKHISDKYIKASGYEKQVHSITGDAMEILPTLSGPFDLIFIDAGKKDNDYYYEQALQLVSDGGYILVDNVLWDGKVISDPDEKMTRYITAFNKKVAEDTRVENVMIPIRDGLSLIRKV